MSAQRCQFITATLQESSHIWIISDFTRTQQENQQPIDTANEHIKHQVFYLLQRNV